MMAYLSNGRDKIAKPFYQVGLSVGFCAGRLGMRIPYTRKKICRWFSKVNRMNDNEKFLDSLFSKQMYKTILKCQMTYLKKTVKKNKELPDFLFYKLEKASSYKEVTLRSMQTNEIPLVINFGSNS